jgi:predicted RNA binding protein YcfA (HicA-like mRNA interferase family)
LKGVSGKDFCRALEEAGWILDRISGSHHIYDKPGHAPASVPVHGNQTLGKGLQRALIKQTGLTDSDL